MIVTKINKVASVGVKCILILKPSEMDAIARDRLH